MSTSTQFHVLHVDASPRTASISRRLGAEFIAALTRARPDVAYTHRDLGADPVPHITEAWTQISDNVMRDRLYDLARLHEAVETPMQQAAWQVLAPYLDEVVAADLIVLTTPMYNFSIPSALKAWLDQITFPKMRLAHRRFVVLAARGGTYQPGTPRANAEHQVRYLTDFIQGHYALPAPDVIEVELANSLVDPDLAGARAVYEESFRAAAASATELAESLAGSRAEL